MTKQVDRRTFLKLAGSGSVAVAAAAVSGSAILHPLTARTLTFRASAGLPAKPMASMVTKIVEGRVDMIKGTGIVNSQVLVGHPEPSQIALPGLSRMIRITTATERAGLVQLTGVVDDRSQLQPGEAPAFHITLDRARGILTMPLAGHSVTLKLEELPA
jgi:hypothetical protein